MGMIPTDIKNTSGNRSPMVFLSVEGQAGSHQFPGPILPHFDRPWRAPPIWPNIFPRHAHRDDPGQQRNKGAKDKHGADDLDYRDYRTPIHGITRCLSELFLSRSQRSVNDDGDPYPGGGENQSTIEDGSLSASEKYVESVLMAPDSRSDGINQVIDGNRGCREDDCYCRVGSREKSVEEGYGTCDEEGIYEGDMGVECFVHVVWIVEYEDHWRGVNLNGTRQPPLMYVGLTRTECCNVIWWMGIGETTVRQKNETKQNIQESRTSGPAISGLGHIPTGQPSSPIAFKQ